MRYQFWRWFVHARRPWSAMGAIKNQGTFRFRVWCWLWERYATAHQKAAR